jgi:exonuclease III
MHILTLNTWHNNGPWLQRRDALIQGILQYAPDILLLQELFDTDWSRELQARLAYPFFVATESADSGLVILSKLPPKSNEIYRMTIKSPFETYWRYALCAELLIDTYETLHPGAAGFTWNSRNLFAQYHRPVLPDRRIDYILADARLAKNLKRCEIVFDTPDALGIFASDHFGVLAEFDK